MNRFKHLSLLLLTVFFSTARAQEAVVINEPLKPFNHLDFSVTSGSTGLGFDFSMPVNDIFSLRAGYAIMPRFTHMMHFGVDVGDDPAKSHDKFERLSGLLEEFTGFKVDNVVDVKGQPTYWNWKLLVDAKPFRNKNWHLTAGFYLGSHEIARAVNATEDMPTLMAVSIYNHLYNRAVSGNTDMTTVGESTPYLEELFNKIKDYGRMSIRLGEYKNDVLYEEDVVAPKGGVIIGDELYMEGDIIHAKGDVMYKAGDPYRIVPDENSMIKAWAYANRFKPYLGFGYGGQLLKNNPNWHVSFDCGAMFWGGTPQIVTHDGTDLVNDVKNVRGKVGDYVDIIKKFKVFPVINLRITRRIF
jgi:hypothetical protein